MSADARKRQKKLERKTAKRREKRHDMVRSASVPAATHMAEASNCPVVNCWISRKLESDGLGWVILSRLLPAGQVAIANFLVDRYCLGIKNVHMDVLPRPVYQARYVADMYRKMDLEDASLADAYSVLERSADYAKSIGFAPHWDYAKALAIFGTVDASQNTRPIEFGKHGDPLFIAGPNDTPERCRQIVATLERTCGEGNYHYMVPIQG